jgi:hypothetical protein
VAERTGQYPYFGEPPSRKPRPALKEPALRGKRVILSTPAGFVYDMRAAGDVYIDGQGKTLVDIVTEREWYASGSPETGSGAVGWPSHLVWVE